MKLRINSAEPAEVIVEIDDVISLRNKLKEVYSTNENLKNKTFFLIYKNIVLNIDKILKFYKISDNDEISVRYLENLLLEDERLLEVFLSGLSPSIMYLIVRQNDSINTIKSTIGNIVQNISKIYDKDSNELPMESKIEDIKGNNEYYKLIISCDNRKVGGENQTFKTCRKIHDRYLIDLYMKKFPSICRIDNENNWKTDLIKKIKELKDKINSSNVDKFNGILSMFSNPLVKSRFLFVTEMAEYINCCCDDLWNEIFDVSSGPVRDYFLAVLHICINEYNEQNQYIIRDIVIEALNKFENYLETYGSDWLNLMKLFLDCCLIRKYSTEKIERIYHTNTDKVNPSFKIRQSQKYYLIDIPSNCNTIEELKLAVSYQTNVEKKYLYFISPKSVHKPKDTDELDINDLDNCLMEIVSGWENFEKIQIISDGGISKVFLCKNTSTNRTFGMKIPKSGEDLYREISNHSRINNCEHVKTYTELILYKDCVCIAMEFMQRGSLISYLEKKKSLHENEISKLSYTLLKQIDEIHKQDMIHRNISGYNIVFDDNGVPVLIDFGLSVHCSFLQDENFVNNLFKDLHGTSGYFAPELLLDSIFTNKIDIWSFGVVVAEMIYGGKLQSELSVVGRKQRELKGTPRPLSDDLFKFCRSCLQIDPNKRSSASKLLKSRFIRHLKMIN